VRAVLAVRRTVNGIETLDVPRPDGAGVRVRITSAGICGSDLGSLAGGPSEITVGHEFAGLLDDGSAVAVKPNLACGQCEHCLGGRDNLCSQGTRLFYGQTLDGGMAEEVLVDPSVLVPLPPGMPAEVAGLVEPIAISVHAVNRGGVESGMRVLVVGAGAIGLTAVMAARAIGADVDVIARHPQQAAAAEALGGHVGATKGYDVVVDSIGSQAALDESIDRARRGATIAEVGGFWAPVEIGIKAMIKEVTIATAIYSAHHHGDSEFHRAAQLLSATPQAAEVLVTHRFPLDRAAEAFRTAADKTSGAIKVHLHP
jgi:2-desacetyl-2-hydroxyethyl bacteriochlorophyllide A dehydrogenase